MAFTYNASMNVFLIFGQYQPTWRNDCTEESSSSRWFFSFCQVSSCTKQSLRRWNDDWMAHIVPHLADRCVAVASLFVLQIPLANSAALKAIGSSWVDLTRKAGYFLSEKAKLTARFPLAAYRTIDCAQFEENISEFFCNFAVTNRAGDIVATDW